MITEWLKGRKQKVGIRGVLSDWVEVLSGVPQGSVLGPLLFLIYINDFGIDNWILKFADDTKIFTRITDDNDWHSLQDDLSKLSTWSEKWQMLFNTSKCKVMHIGKSQKKYPYYTNNQQLEEVTQEKDLGIVTKAPGSHGNTGISSKEDVCENAKHHTEIFYKVV